MSTHLAVLERAFKCFEQRFGALPETVVCAPGRVNLIGEHTDYNDGFVLPMAIDRGISIALRIRHDDQTQVFASDFNEQASFSLKHFQKGPTHWIEYIKGAAWALQEAGHHLQCWEGVVVGDVPIGSGLSSSAALELAVLRAFASVSNFDWNPVNMAKIGQRIENDWIGVSSGIMDQMVSASGRENHAMLLDCRSLEIKWIPIPSDAIVIVLDTSTQRDLVDSNYNERRRQCELATRCLGGASLRDLTMTQLESQAKGLDKVIYQRARHVISENERTLQAAEALSNGDLPRFGKLMNESHQSLCDDFEVSSEALNQTVCCAQQQPSCYGARMTGAGFAGCAVAVVDRCQARIFEEQAANCYQTKSGLILQIYTCKASQGTTIVHDVSAGV